MAHELCNIASLYRCDKPHGHEGRHAVQHGNLENMKFAADSENIDMDDRKCAPVHTGSFYFLHVKDVTQAGDSICFGYMPQGTSDAIHIEFYAMCSRGYPTSAAVCAPHSKQYCACANEVNALASESIRQGRQCALGRNSVRVVSTLQVHKRRSELRRDMRQLLQPPSPRPHPHSSVQPSVVQQPQACWGASLGPEGLCV